MRKLQIQKKNRQVHNIGVRTLSPLLVPLLLSLNSWAGDIQVNPSHPNQYTVVKGDTLWDISGKFLQTPWQWPQVWKNNSQINNPHLIYPGDTIYFTVVDGQPQLSLTKDDKLVPHIRETPIEEAITLIPIDAISPFLTSPKVATKYELENSPYVIDIAGEHIVAGAGDRVYVRSIVHPKGLAYTIYRPGKTYENPETKEILGYEAQYIANTTLQKSGDPATLLITDSDQETRIGDRLIAAAEEQVTLNYFPRAPETTINGSIISVLHGVYQVGQYDIVVIDKGIEDGLQSGHVLDIYQEQEVIKDPYSINKFERVKLPEEFAGTLMIFRPFERVSYAIVMYAVEAIHLFDKVKTP